MIVKHPREYVVDKLQYALNPKTIAVVGASRYSTKVGYKVVDGLLTWGYKGKIYPVNPRADKVAGFTAYKTVKDIPDEIDLAFLAVPAHIRRGTRLQSGKGRDGSWRRSLSGNNDTL